MFMEGELMFMAVFVPIAFIGGTGLLYCFVRIGDRHE